MNANFNVGRFLRWCATSVLIVFVLYACLVIGLTWPISTLSVDKAGTFGDSFGVLTSLFTGLGFAGLLTTIFLQREDLKLNRRELEETRDEIRLQSETFYRQRFEDAFYRMLSLYKENLKELSIRNQEEERQRIFGIDALNYLIGKFDKAWAKLSLPRFPGEEDEQREYLYLLASTIQSVFIRQSRYVETLTSILILIDEECVPKERKHLYWRILTSQLTAYEVKYLFYQSLVMPDFKPLRDMISNSEALQQRLATMSILDGHRKAFEVIWKIPLPKKRSPYIFPLSAKELRDARRRNRKRRKQEHAVRKTIIAHVVTKPQLSEVEGA